MARQRAIRFARLVLPTPAAWELTAAIYEIEIGLSNNRAIS